jgi:RNA polymerase sigma factor (sigma-70 family)
MSDSDLKPEPPESDAIRTGSEELIRRFQAGEDHALNQLWARYLPRLTRWASGRLPRVSRTDTNTDDLIQETFVRSLAHMRTLRPQDGRSLFAYFRKVVLNQIRDHARRVHFRSRQEELLPEGHAADEPSPLEQLMGKEVMERYERALSTLSEDDQHLIVAFVELRCTDREIAELFEKPSVDAARMARTRAVTRLANVMAHPSTGASPH